MKQPMMFNKLLRDWISMPRSLDEFIAVGMAARELRPGWVPLKGLSAISDLLPPKAYATPACADEYNRVIRKFRRRLAFSAYMAGISKADLEARLETHAMLMAVFQRQDTARS